MSVNYGGAAYGGTGYAPPGRVNFGWINESFDLFKSNAGIWIVAVLLTFAVPAVIGGIVGAAAGAAQAASGSSSGPYGGGSAPGMPGLPAILSGGLPLGVNLAIRLFSTVYTAFMYGGLFRMAVKQVRREPIEFSDVFSGGPLFLRMLGFNVVFGFAVVFGLLLLIVPGLLAAALLLPAWALIADGETVSGAISRSIDGMKRDVWNAVALLFVMGLLIFASAIPCGLGVFVTYPMFWIISALAYRDMVGMPMPPGPGYAAPAYGTPGVWPPPPGATPPPPSFGQPPYAGPPAYGQPPPNPYAPPPPNPPPAA